jgi:hypothetical protein
MANPWFLVLPVAGIGWWLLGFPPGWGWLLVPLIPTMPVNAAELVSLVCVVIGAYAGLAWLRSNL